MAAYSPPPTSRSTSAVAHRVETACSPVVGPARGTGPAPQDAVRPGGRIAWGAAVGQVGGGRPGRHEARALDADVAPGGKARAGHRAELARRRYRVDRPTGLVGGDELSSVRAEAAGCDG